jgi:hypothetical protein
MAHSDHKLVHLSLYKNKTRIKSFYFPALPRIFYHCYSSQAISEGVELAQYANDKSCL